MAIQEYPKMINSPTAGRIVVTSKEEEQDHLGEEVQPKDDDKKKPWGGKGK